ncbi:MAG: tRNA lysidine(34) synthetase TilS, partial [Treponema sp.]|nr:tRNA lysidine(34) synthetase TilS [Treponema sp.]
MELLSGVHADAFTRAVERGLQSCGVDLVRLGREQQPLGGAVSGGADSMALLVALCSLCRAYGVSLHVITVNHNMRDEAAACGDAAFVAARCAEFSAVGVPVSCTIKTIPPGRVAAVAAERQCGTEAAARSVRYEAFHAFATQARLAYLCLAHTADDQLETIVMRFLQGSGRSGMRSVRGIFVRPLLALSRADVESFLHRHALSWRYDETNADTQYLRNRIRTVLLPQLDGLVPGWRRAVLTGHERAADAVSAIRSAADCIALHEIRNGGACRAVSVVQDELMKLPRAVRIQVVYNACNLLCIGGRIPYWFVSAVADGTMGSAAGVTAWQDGGHLFFKKTEKGATDSGF